MITFKKVTLRFGLLANKNILIIDFINNSYCKYLFYYLQLNEDNNQQNKLL